MSYKKWNKLYKEIKDKELSNEVSEIFSNYGKKWLNKMSKEELVSNVSSIFTDISSLKHLDNSQDTYNAFLEYLDYCSDRMCLSRYIRLSILLQNALNFKYEEEQQI